VLLDRNPIAEILLREIKSQCDLPRRHDHGDSRARNGDVYSVAHATANGTPLPPTETAQPTEVALVVTDTPIPATEPPSLRRLKR
jgi:hypothetical protein